jgi:hypothetical protein
VLTTRTLLDKLKLEPEAESVFVEDLRTRIGPWDKVVGAFQALAVPRALLARHLGARETKPYDILGTTPEGGLRAAGSGVPDPRKGERLVVVHTPRKETPGALCKALAAEGLPNLYVPSRDSWCEVPELPLLGTGKLALQEIHRLALAYVEGQG